MQQIRIATENLLSCFMVANEDDLNALVDALD